MSRTVSARPPLALGLLAAGIVAASGPAMAQVDTLERRARGEPVGIAVPGLSVAGADEPTALELNPAGVGFVDGLTLQYFHEGRARTSQVADGAWLAAAIGPLVPALSMQWIRPRNGGGPRFRKTVLGAALSDHRIASLGFGYTFFDTPDPVLDQLGGLDLGLTLRPFRSLSVGFSVLGMTARLAGRRLPVRYDLGLGTRLLQDRLTVTADLLMDDRGRQELSASATQLGVALDVVDGVSLGAQARIPLHASAPGPDGAAYLQLALTVNSAHAGITAAGAGGDGADRTWLLGGRLSTSRYRGLPGAGSGVPFLDVGASLSQARSPLAREADLQGALVRRLVAVRDDPSLPALAVEIGDLPAGHGRIEELRQLLLEVKARKPVVAYLTGGGLKELYLASAASIVVSPPSTALLPNGLSASTPFLREGLERLGVTFDVVAIGKYKNAPDPLVRKDMSEAQREVTAQLLEDVFGREVRGIASGRGLDPARVRELVDVGVFTADAARRAGLVDVTAFRDAVEALVSARVGRGVHLLPGWERPEPRAAERWGPRRGIALIRLEGAIVQGKSRAVPFASGRLAGAETITALLRRAAADGDVLAVVLRIDSPGGDALASDLIWREVVRTREAGKPVVVSMGDVAASGGYLVAVGANDIVAEGSTLTGSVGVFALKPDLSGLLGKLGVNTVTVKRGRHADLNALTRRWTDEERALVERQVGASYELFLSRVAEGRRLSREAVERVAAGRVWTGAQALQHGLVDRMGSLDDAVALARERCGHPSRDDLEVLPFEPPRGILGALAGELLDRVDAEPASLPIDALLSALGGRLPELGSAAALLEMGPLVSLPPEWASDLARPASARER